MKVETQSIVDRLNDAANRAGLACKKDGTNSRVSMIQADHLREAIALIDSLESWAAGVESDNDTLRKEIDRLNRENLALRAEVAEAKVRENRRQHDADVERRAFAHVMHIERGGVE